MLSTLTFLAALTGAAPAEASALATPAPIVRVKDDVAPALIRTDDKLELRGDFYAPRHAEGRAPAVLLIHDAGSDRASVASIAEALQRADFGVLALDLRGHGESASDDLNWTDLDDEGRAKLWAFAARDLDAGADWLADQRGIHSSNLTVIGVGASGALAVRHALRDDNVRSVGVVGFQRKSFGLDLGEDVADLEGLPTLFAVTREQRDGANELVTELDGEDWITVKPLRAKPEELLSDKKLPRTLVDFASEHAMPNG